MERYRFYVNKPKSITVRTDLSVENDIVNCEYVICDCLFCKNTMRNFQIRKSDIKKCKLCLKIYVNSSDILFYIALLGLMLVGYYYQNIIGIPFMTTKIVIIFIIAVLFFTLLKLTRIIKIQTSDGDKYEIPVAGFFIYPFHSDKREDIEKLYRSLSREF